MKAALELRRLNPALHDLAHVRFEERDIAGVLCLVDGHVRVAFVKDNIQVLKDVGLYEQALLNALLGSSQTNAHYQSQLLMMLLLHADRDRMFSVTHCQNHQMTITPYIVE